MERSEVRGHWSIPVWFTSPEFYRTSHEQLDEGLISVKIDGLNFLGLSGLQRKRDEDTHQDIVVPEFFMATQETQYADRVKSL